MDFVEEIKIHGLTGQGALAGRVFPLGESFLQIDVFSEAIQTEIGHVLLSP